MKINTQPTKLTIDLDNISEVELRFNGKKYELDGEKLGEALKKFAGDKLK